MILFNGRDDYNVSASLAAEWFERLKLHRRSSYGSSMSRTSR